MKAPIEFYSMKVTFYPTALTLTIQLKNLVCDKFLVMLNELKLCLHSQFYSCFYLGYSYFYILLFYIDI